MARKEGIKRGYFILASGTMLAGAAAWDFWTHRIPNWWLGFWLVQILFPFFKTGGAELFQFLGNALLAAVITSILFYFRFIGAGDCKLMSLMCGYLGISRGVQVIGTGFIIGAVWSLGKLFIYQQTGQRLSYLSAWFRQSIQEQKRIPYFQEERDGKQAVIPLAVCFLAGFFLKILLNW